MTEQKRDLAADLAICDLATEGPWAADERDEGFAVVTTYKKLWDDSQGDPTIGEIVKPCLGVVEEDDARFIAAARTGWPNAIRRVATMAEVLEKEKRILTEACLNCAAENHQEEQPTVCGCIITQRIQAIDAALSPAQEQKQPGKYLCEGDEECNDDCTIKNPKCCLAWPQFEPRRYEDPCEKAREIAARTEDLLDKEGPE